MSSTTCGPPVLSKRPGHPTQSSPSADASWKPASPAAARNKPFACAPTYAITLAEYGANLIASLWNLQLSSQSYTQQRETTPVR
jgi:hypothetical protein